MGPYQTTKPLVTLPSISHLPEINLRYVFFWQPLSVQVKNTKYQKTLPCELSSEFLAHVAEYPGSGPQIVTSQVWINSSIRPFGGNMIAPFLKHTVPIIALHVKVHHYRNFFVFIAGLFRALSLPTLHLLLSPKGLLNSMNLDTDHGAPEDTSDSQSCSQLFSRSIFLPHSRLLKAYSLSQNPLVSIPLSDPLRLLPSLFESDIPSLQWCLSLIEKEITRVLTFNFLVLFPSFFFLCQSTRTNKMELSVSLLSFVRLLKNSMIKTDETQIQNFMCLSIM